MLAVANIQNPVMMFSVAASGAEDAKMTGPKFLSAKFHGKCICCGQPFRSRNEIAYATVGGKGVTAHASCYRRATSTDAPSDYVTDVEGYYAERAAWLAAWTAATTATAARPPSRWTAQDERDLAEDMGNFE